MDDVVLEAIEDSSERKQAYSVLQENLETIQKRVKEIEDEQLVLSEKLAKIEKDDRRRQHESKETYGNGTRSNTLRIRDRLR